MSIRQNVFPGVDRMAGRVWKNRHETVSQRIAGIYDVYNTDSDDKLETYNTATRSLQWLIGEAVSGNHSLHALGGGWSLTPVSVTPDFMVNTKPLRLQFSISRESIAPGYSGNAANLRYVQCGTSITRLNRTLREKKKSLKTSGSSNGQTIVGAISTGTHGSTFDFGSLQECVVGLHLVVDADRHIWLERESCPVTADNFACNFGAERIANDPLFNAALVSLGAFGFIHGVLLEVEPRFLLEAYRVWLPYNSALKKTVSTLDFSGLDLPDTRTPYHFELVFNPNESERRAFVLVMYKRPYRPNYPHPERETDEIGLGDGALAVIGRILDVLPARLTRSGINSSVAEEYAEYGPKWGTIGEIFSSETVRGKTLSAAMAVPLEKAEQALEAAFTAHKNQRGLFAGLISLRYVKGSAATLAFTRFERTAVLEIDGIYSDTSVEFLKKVWKQLDAEKIPYTQHWGKINNLTAHRVRRGHGDDRVDAWIKARHELLSPEAMQVFSNPFLRKTGLA